MSAVTDKRVLLAAPRSFCAGVDRAIEIVERLLEQHGAPVYVRHQIVHNENVVRRLEDLGAVFVPIFHACLQASGGPRSVRPYRRPVQHSSGETMRPFRAQCGFQQ